MNQPDEFYIGWEGKAAPGIGKTVHRATVGLLLGVVIAAILFALLQRLINVSVFEWGNLKTFSGILEAQPYPHLLVTRPGRTGAALSQSTYYLVAPWKFGLDLALINSLNGKPVSLKGTLIYRDNQTMIEALPASIQAAAMTFATPPASVPVSLGKQTFIGEIVDSKCFLGVMNPGQYIPHRACAIRCISGGAPPLLVVHSADGSTVHLLLVSSEGKPVNQQVLDVVAEPVEITGEVIRQDGLLILRADPATYRRAR